MILLIVELFVNVKRLVWVFFWGGGSYHRIIRTFEYKDTEAHIQLHWWRFNDKICLGCSTLANNSTKPCILFIFVHFHTVRFTSIYPVIYIYIHIYIYICVCVCVWKKLICIWESSRKISTSRRKKGQNWTFFLWQHSTTF